MTNYEKYKNEIIKMLIISVETCNKIWQFRTGSEDAKCPFYMSSSNYKLCEDCERLNEQWLNEDVKEFEPAEFKEGDKIVMRKHENTEFSEFEVVCNRSPYCWLRFMGLENNKAKPDKGFLISYERLMSEYDVKEVLI